MSRVISVHYDDLKQDRNSRLRNQTAKPNDIGLATFLMQIDAPPFPCSSLLKIPIPIPILIQDTGDTTRIAIQTSWWNQSTKLPPWLTNIVASEKTCQNDACALNEKWIILKLTAYCSVGYIRSLYVKKLSVYRNTHAIIHSYGGIPTSCVWTWRVVIGQLVILFLQISFTVSSNLEAIVIKLCNATL